jgi:hypothetical protein
VSAGQGNLWSQTSICSWHARLDVALRVHGYLPSTSDTSLFLLQWPQVTVYLMIYVDDIIFARSSSSAVDALITALSTDFAIKDLDKLQIFLGLKVTHPDDGLSLTQNKYSWIYCTELVC